MELRLLGPVELRVAGQAVDAGGPRQRSVLAALGVDVGRAVPTETLIDRVWDQAPPPRARHTLQAYLARIRTLLGTDQQEGSARVVRRLGGYLLEADPQCVDMYRFQELIQQTCDPDLADRQRVELLGRALDLWRGPPLADLLSLWATRVRQGWQQQRLEAATSWGQAQLRLGDPTVVLARLGELIGEHPLAESLTEVFLRALCAAGRPAEALDHYAKLRRVLAEKLGVDPAPQLQQLHRQILTDGPALDPVVAPMPDPTPAAWRPVPRQLPPPPQMFTGRVRELAALDRLHDASTVVITAIDGMAGIGKTALAVHAAHRLAEHYPDGQLFIDLHGFTEAAAPVEPVAALERLLRDLGVAGEHIPGGLDRRAALWRTRLAGRKMLMVLDNAASERQVAPLLPGNPGCLVLVTSRRRLAGLDHTYTLSLETLQAADATALLSRTVGPDRLVGVPPELLIEMVELCGHLPLAIRIAAARLRSHPAWDVAELLQRLRDQQHRLAELSAGHRSVAAALDVSYLQLPAELRRTYRLLGLHPGADIDTYAAAALAGTTSTQAQRLLEQLLEVHLLQEPTPRRYRFHDLIRAHATAAAFTTDNEPDRHTALTRLFDFYRHTASMAMDTAYPERERRSRVPPADTPPPDLPGPASAIDWLDSELPNLLAAGHAAAGDWPEHTVHLSTILHRHLHTRGRYSDAETLHHQALTTARTTGNRNGELDALTGLGRIHLRQGRYAQAADHFTRALEIARTTGNREASCPR